jgi:HSP20 family protein
MTDKGRQGTRVIREVQLPLPYQRLSTRTQEKRIVSIPARRKRRGHMARWYYKSIFDELDEMRNYMDALFQQMYGTNPTALLPSAGESATKLLPVQPSRLRVDVIEQTDEVVVTADLIPGITKKDISLDLINPQALEISWERKEEKKEEKEGYYLRERRFGSMTRIVPLPVPVTEDKATATVKNGVLEVHLKKTKKEPKAKIAIE